MFTRPTAPLSIGGVIDASIRLYPSSFRRWWLPSLIGSLLGRIPVLFLLFVAGGLGIAGSPGGQRNPGAAAAALQAAFRSPVTWWTYAAVIVLTVWTYLAVNVAINRAYNDESGGAGGAMAAAIRLLPKAVLASFLTLLAIMGGMILLIIPGLWLAGRLYYVLPAMINEGLGPLASMRRSYELTRGHWWRSFAILSVAIVIVVVLSLAVGLVNGVAIVTMTGHPLALLLIGQGLAAVTGALTAPMIYAVVVAAYHDFVLRKDGGDLEARVGGLSAD